MAPDGCGLTTELQNPCGLIDEQALVEGRRQRRGRDDGAWAPGIRSDTQNAGRTVRSEEGLEREAVVLQGRQRRRERQELDLNWGRRGDVSAPEIHRRVVIEVKVVQSPAET